MGERDVIGIEASGETPEFVHTIGRVAPPCPACAAKDAEIARLREELPKLRRASQERGRRLNEMEAELRALLAEVSNHTSQPPPPAWSPKQTAPPTGE